MDSDNYRIRKNSSTYQLRRFETRASILRSKLYLMRREMGLLGEAEMVSLVGNAMSELQKVERILATRLVQVAKPKSKK